MDRSVSACFLATARHSAWLPGRLLVLALAAGLLGSLSGCYSEFMGPAPGNLTLAAEQPGGSFRTGSVNDTQYQVHFFWGIWSPYKTNSWETLTKAVHEHSADGAYNVRIETYMPWWHVFMFWVSAGIVDVSGHTITADTYKYSRSGAVPTPMPGAQAGPAGVQPNASPPGTAPPAPLPQASPKPIISGPADQPPPPTPRPGRAPSTDPNAPKPVVAPATP